MEPPIGIEPMTYALREARFPALRALAATMPRAIAHMAPVALGFCADPVHATVHGRACVLLLHVNIVDDMDPRSKRTRRRGQRPLLGPQSG